MKVKTLIMNSSVTKYRIKTANSTYIVDYTGKLNESEKLYRSWVELPEVISNAKVDLISIYDDSTLELDLTF